MRRHKLAVAKKLDDLGDLAKRWQAEGAKTAKSLDHLPSDLKTFRRTLSLLLVHGDTVLMHKEPKPKKKDTDPNIVKAAVFGGGMESEIEKKIKLMMKLDPGAIDKRLLKEDGSIPPGLFYYRLGKALEEEGRLIDMGFPLTKETFEEHFVTDLRKRMGMEVGSKVLQYIGKPLMLNGGEPMVTHVLDRCLGPYTESIAQDRGMEVNADGELVGIGITVEERFFMSRLLTDPKRFQALTEENVIAWSWDQFIAIAERDTKDPESWGKRMQYQGGNDEFPIRNESLLRNGAAASREDAKSNWLFDRIRHISARLRRQHLSVAA